MECGSTPWTRRREPMRGLRQRRTTFCEGRIRCAAYCNAINSEPMQSSKEEEGVMSAYLVVGTGGN